MTANATRGEISIALEGVDYTLRPSYEAISAIEAETGQGLYALAQLASDGSMPLKTAATICTHCIRAHGAALSDAALQGVNADKIGRLILSAEGGLLMVLLRLKLLLAMAVTGGFAASGEPKAAAANGTTPAAN